MKALIIYFREILYLIGQDKVKLPWMILLFFIGSLLDAIGIGLMGPYVTLLMNPASTENSILLEVREIFGMPSNDNIFLIVISSLFVGLFIIKGVLGILILKIIASFSYKQQVSIRSQLMRSYQSMSYENYINRNTSEYIYAIQTLVATFTGKIMMLGLRTISDIIMTCAIIIVLAWVDIKLLGVLLLLVSMVVIIYDRLIRNSLKTYGKDANEASTKLVKGVTEGITGMKELRVLGKEGYFHNLVHKEATNYANKLKKTELITGAPKYLMEFVVIGFLVLLVIVELLTTGLVNQLIPTLAMFAVASIKLVPSYYSISVGVMHFRFNRHTVSLLYKDMKRFEGVNTTKTAFENDSKFNKLTLDSINYQYSENTGLVVNNTSLSIKKGETVGIIGPSGSGKTTLVDVILGLLKPQEGDIILDGKRINDCMSEWQSKVAYLPQQVFIIDDTLKNNIALGVDPLEIDETSLNKAIDRSRLKEVVNNLPKGIDTRLGEHGIGLSGGQRQRVSLARAIYHKREVLVMDEATSALDEVTEREVVDEIRRFKGNATIIIIAHRHNTLKYCDRIYRLNNGRVVEETTYADLINE